MKIKTKLTLWFTFALIIIVLITYIIILSASNNTIHNSLKANLLSVINNNYLEIEVIDDEQDEEDSNYNTYYFEIDDDYHRYDKDVISLIMDNNYEIVDGSNEYRINEEFISNELREIKYKNQNYYIYDINLKDKGLDGLWLRGIVKADNSGINIKMIFNSSLIYLPLLILIASIGGYLMASRTLKPIKNISDSAKNITKANDLNKRIDNNNNSKDELNELVNSFNAMLERLEDSFKKEKQFTSDVSHELRTPITVIKAQSELALKAKYNKNEYLEAFSLINRQSDKMTKLLSNMLEYTRLELKAEQYQKETFDLSETIELLVLDMSLIKDKNISLTYDIKEDIEYYGNRFLIERMMQNLIANAYRYGIDDGYVKVSLDKNKDNIIIVVEDNGIGIDIHEQALIFDRFYKSDTSRNNEGTGLGLAFVKEIIKYHDAEIKLESEINKGSKFIIIL